MLGQAVATLAMIMVVVFGNAVKISLLYKLLNFTLVFFGVFVVVHANEKQVARVFIKVCAIVLLADLRQGCFFALVPFEFDDSPCCNLSCCELFSPKKVIFDVMAQECFEFVVYMIHACANRWNRLPSLVYRKLAGSDCIQKFLVPNYEILHTQSTDFVLNDIEEYLKVRKVAI